MFRIAFSALPALVFYGTGHPILFWLSVGVGIVTFWSLGVMHNFAMTAAKRRYDQLAANMLAEGRPHDVASLDDLIIRPINADIEAVPNWLAVIDMLAMVAVLVLLVWGVVVRIL